jgi:NADPH:quinone reductase-like Zn-dependent oxidoreductase
VRALAMCDEFGIDHLRFVERSDAEIGPAQIRIQPLAVSLNYRDLLMVRGLYNPRQPLPLIPCSDAVATVIEVGTAVTSVVPGARVCPVFCPGWLDGEVSRVKLRSTLGGPLDGTLATSMVLHHSEVVEVPDYLSDAQASALPCAALTAYHALFGEGRPLEAGQTVLVQGTGGVSVFAMQFALAIGAKVIATSKSEEKLARLQSLGVEMAINYREEPSWGRLVAKFANAAQGVDHVVEVGGAGTLEESISAVRYGGTISLIGVLAGTSRPLNILPILMRNIRLQGIFVGSRKLFEEMVVFLEQHQVAPIVDRVFDFDDAVEAFRYLGRGEHFGKVCVRVSDAPHISTKPRQ